MNLPTDISMKYTNAAQMYKKNFSLKNLLTEKNKKIIFLGSLVLIIALVGAVWVNRMNSLVKQPPSDSQATLKEAIASQSINKEYKFPVKDGTKVVTNIKYSIENAELRDEIIIQGKKAVTVDNRTFLILTIKITNDFDKGLEINARDYVRLSVNGNGKELLAADIHNDPITIQPISTKYTRIGFPINKADKNLMVHVGEIAGTKDKIALALQTK
jgi:hypothetical protein